MSRNLRAHLSVLMANLIYGANYSIAKGVMPEFIKPFGFIIIRVWVAAILFVLSAQLLFREKIKRGDWPLFIGCAVFGVAINQLLFFKGLSLTSPINSGLIMVTNPIFVLIGSAMVAREKITLLKVLGILSGLSGAVLLIIYGQRFSSSASDTMGDICILLNSLSYAVYLVMVRPLMRRYHPVTIMQVVFLIGSLLVLPFGLEEFMEIRWDSFGLSTWMATAFVVIGTTFLAYLFNTLALRELSANMVSVYIYLQPLLAAGFAMLLGKDVPNLLHLLSALLIFGGIWLTMRSGESLK